jgi:RNA chaperone Hfq
MEPLDAASTSANDKRDRAPRLQAEWLCQAKGQAVTVHLMSGKGVTGRLVAFDQFCIALVLADQREPVLNFKHAVACLSRAPSR